MPSVFVDDVEIKFPFEPYAAQVAYMRAVIDALNRGANALLESPTGTGKTLCLLCATLAWLERRRASATAESLRPRPTAAEGREGLPRVVYCSRTHAQLSQVIREMKRTAYGGIFSMALLGSREHMCVNSQVLRLPTSQAQQSMCNTLRDEKACRFHRGFLARGFNKNTEGDQWVHDMEDLVTEGRKSVFCPYYWEREQSKESDVVFLPYNYVLDMSLRKQLPFDLKGAILIADEAHNLPSILGASSCVNLQPLELTNAIHDCARAIAVQRLLVEQKALAGSEQEGLMDEQELASLKIILCDLESFIAAEKPTTTSEHKEQNHIVRGSTSVDELVREGSYMISFLSRALITRDLFVGDGRQAGGLNEVITKAIALLTQSESAATGLAKVQQFLSFVFEHCDDGDDEARRFVIQTSSSGGQRALGYWCLDTSCVMTTLVSGLRSLLLTSGTLSPLDHFAAELGLPFDVCLKGSHVIDSSHVIGCVLCKGPGGEKLNGSYVFRSSVDYRVGLGMALVNLARNVPGGVLVFFPSYAALSASVNIWRMGSGRTGDTVTVWAMLEELKPVFVEPGDTADLQAIVTNFQSEVDRAPHRGAMLLAVCRGKISEGIDFADNHGRCVVVAGIPFANHTDLYVRLKREYITRVAPQRPKVRGRPFTGDDWYRNEAMRAVNQCVGRVIRHKDDYGAVVLADERFSDRVCDLSEWISERCAVHREFRETYAGIAQFFAAFRRRAPTTTVPPVAPALMAMSKSVSMSMSVSMDDRVPDSAALARRFASEEEARRVEAVREAERRRRSETSGETKEPQQQPQPQPQQQPVPVPAVVPAPPAQRPQFRKQTLPPVPSAPGLSAAAVVVGPTSREFCQFLKERLLPARYDSFRVKLREIAAIRSSAVLSVDEVKAMFSRVVDELAILFREAAGEDDMVLTTAFGQHIPEEFRTYYAHLVRKRRRSSAGVD